MEQCLHTAMFLLYCVYAVVYRQSHVIFPALETGTDGEVECLRIITIILRDRLSYIEC